MGGEMAGQLTGTVSRSALALSDVTLQVAKRQTLLKLMSCVPPLRTLMGCFCCFRVSKLPSAVPLLLSGLRSGRRRPPLACTLAVMNVSMPSEAVPAAGCVHCPAVARFHPGLFP
jgi:hypothetical protein